MAGIRTPDSRVRVFLSSTLGELAAERAAVHEAIERLRLIPVLFELGARPHPPRALYRAYLDQSDVFVGVYWERYGWVAPGEEVSGLEDEYRLAAGRKPQLVYIKEPAPGREAALDALLERIQGDDRLAYRRFGTADELAGLVSDDLIVLLSERFHPNEPDESDAPRAFGPPAPLDRTFGREQAVDAVVDLTRSGHRLVTLTGPGGIGKSRLAVEATRALAGDFDGRVVYVPLASISDPALVLQTIGERLGVRLGGVGDLLDEIAAECRERTLLLLDNFEHVAAAAPDLTALLTRCPCAVALVTSRHVLRVQGERELQVPPLAADAAIELFVERAVGVRPGFVLNGENRELVEEICRRLDHLPLAIELAAACMRLFSPATVLEQLSERLDLLRGGAADAPNRQQTLRSTMDWSYDLLDERERRLFARLAAFSGGWTLAAASAVCGGADEPDLLETLGSLVEKSLVVAMDDTSAEPRLRMLETVRAYASEKLAELPDRAAIERRHTDWMFELLIGESRSIRPPHHQSWLEGFDLERANLRSAIQRAIRDGDAATVIDLVRSSLGYLSLRDAEAEAAQWLDAAMAAAVDGLDPVVHARLLRTRAVLAGALGRYEDATALLDHAGSIGAPLTDPFDIAISSMAEAVVGSALQPPTEALPIALHAVESMAAMNSDVGEAYMWQTAGTIALGCDPEVAERYLANGLRLAEEMANDGLRGQSLTLIGYSARRAGRAEEARERFIAAATAAQRSGQRSSMAYALDGLAAAALDMGRADTAVRALAASESARSSLDRTPWASFNPLLDEVAAAARTELGDDGYAAARVEGAEGDLGLALRQALDVVTGGP